MKIADLSVKNPVLVNILMFAVLALGAFSLTRLPQEQFSEVPLFFVNVIVPYPGVSAEDVEQSVTIPIEQEMQGIDSLEQISSNTTEGLSTVTLQFDDGLSNDEFDRLFQEVQNRFTTVDLPDGTLQAIIDDFSSNDFLPVIEVILHGTEDFALLDQTARDLADRIRQRNDVSGVDLIGTRDREITIDARQERMEALGVNLNEIVQAIQGQNVTVPAGTLRSSDREYLLRTVGSIDDPEEFRRLVIRSTSSGIVRLEDVADVELGFEAGSVSSRLNGAPAITLRVNKVPRGNSVGVIESVREEVDSIATVTPSQVEFTLSNDSTVQIRDSISVLLNNALFGLGLLVVILFLFIGFRNAVMTALGVPITFAITFVVLELLGETFNSNTLFGMVLVLGLIVDHAIVIVENSYRYRQMGLSRHEAAIKGTNEVIIPVIAATATTVAAFLPLTLLPGVIGLFLRVVPLTVSIALIASTFEAAFFLPSHFADWPGGNKEPKRRFFEAMQRGFKRLVSATYRYRGVTVAVMLVILVGSFTLVPFIQQDLFSAEDFTLFYVELEMPPGTPDSRTAEIVGRYEDRILPLVGNGEIVSVNSTVGFSQRDTEAIRRGNVAQLVIDITEQDEGRTRSITEVIAEVQDLIRDVPGADTVQFRRATNGPPTDPPVVFRIFGDDFTELRDVSAGVTGRLRGYPELINIEDNLEVGTPEFQVVVDEERAASFGLSAGQVGQFLRTSFDGIPASTVFVNNEEFDVIVRYAGTAEATPDEILQLRIPTPDGRLIPFSNVADLVEADALAGIKRLDGKREVTITADTLSTENLGAINDDIRAFFDAEYLSRYPGVTLSVGGEFAEFANLLIEILRIFLIGILLIYLILGTQFKSYSQPLLILMSVPFAFVGVILFLVASGTPLSTTVIYASVALAGIAVNDTIVLVSFVNERRAEGASVRDAVIEGATTRLRPIILTSITTIAGLLPTAIGIGGRSVIWGPMASTIIFGLVFSTITALLVVPSIYGLLYDREAATRRREARAERKSKRKLTSKEPSGEPAYTGGDD
jgi:multidrug efflux pump subunit AcrB